MSKSAPRSNRPKLTLVAVQSLDGCITRGDTSGVGFASRADQDWFKSILPGFDSAIMGRRTYEAARTHILESIDRRPERLRIVATRHPEAWRADHRPGVLEFTDLSPSGILDDLARRGRHNTILLGGAVINRLFLSKDLVDHLWLTVEPVLFGTGQRLVNGRVEARFHLEKFEPLAPSVLLLKYERTRESLPLLP